MTSWSRIHYSLLTLALIIVLTGCELARDNSEVSDMSPTEALPPTLAPLGSEDTSLASEATPVPTVLNVQPTATPASEISAIETEPIELVAPTAQAAEAEPAEENIIAAAPAVDEGAPASEAPAQSIVVDAAEPEALPDGGPIAVNPPYSETSPVIPAASAGGNYVVQAGDTLYNISQRYGTSIQAIVAANGLTSDVVKIGQTLTIPGNDPYTAPTGDGGYMPAPMPLAPGGPNTYLVTPSDTLFSIAMRFGTSVEAIASANNIIPPYIIHAGQPLLIPGYNGAMPAPGYNPNPAYPQQPPVDGYYQQPPVDGYYQQPGQGYPQQPPVDNYYQQPGQGYPQQPPVDGYYPQPGQDYPQQPPVDGYYPQPGQDGSYQPGYNVPTMPGGAGTHTVAAGETLYSIARRYGVSAEAIAAANGLGNPNQLFVGQVLYLP